MIKKIALIIILLIVFTGAVSAEDNLTDAPDEILSEGDELNMEDIQEKINAASDGDVIEINASCEVSHGIDLSIDKSITLEGSDDEVVIEGALSFHTCKGDITLKNLKFNHIRIVDYFITNNANLTLMNCHFTDVGDCIMNNGRVTLIDCSFNDTSYGIMNNGDVTMTNCQISETYCIDNNGTLRMDNCHGDSLYQIINNGTLRMDNCHGDSLYQIINTGNLTVDCCEFKDDTNQVANHGNASISECNFTSPVRITNKGDLSIRKSRLNNSRMENENKLTLSDSSLSNGYWISSSDSFEATQCDFSGENGYLSFGGVYAGFFNSTLNKNHWTAFTADENRMINSRIIGADSFSALEFSKNLEVRACEIESCTLRTAGNSGTIILNDNVFKGSYIDCANNGLKCHNSTFDNTRIMNDFESTFNVELDNCTLANASLIYEGNYVFKNTRFIQAEFSRCQGYDLLIDNCNFISNRADGDMLNHECEMEETRKTFKITNSRFINNTCERLIDFGQFTPYTILNNNVFINNTCEYLFYWSYTLDFYSRTEKQWNSYRSGIDFSNNIVISNFNRNQEYSRIHIDPTLYYSAYDKPNKSFNILIKDNFFGFNMEHTIEQKLIPIFEYEGVLYLDNARRWANIDLSFSGDEYTLKFMNPDGQGIAMPTTHFTVRDIETGEVLLSHIPVEDGIGKFKLNRTPDEIVLLNDANGVVNKPKAKMTLDIVGDSYEHITITVKLENNGTALKNQQIIFEYVQSDETGDCGEMASYRTDDKGKALLYESDVNRPREESYLLDNGDAYKFKLIISFADPEFGLTQIVRDNFKIKKMNAELNVKDMKTTYNSNANLIVTLTNKNTNKLIKESGITVTITKNGKSVKFYDLRIHNSKAVLKLPRLNAGTYKAIIKLIDPTVQGKSKTITLKVNPQKLKVKVSKFTAKYKKSKQFKFTVKNAKKVKVKLKIGKKVYKVKTDRKGVVKFNTKSLKRGTHNVVISSGDGNYKFSAKSSIKII